MTLNEIESQSSDQEKGRWFGLLDPVDGKPVGIRLRIAGPDSRTQRRAELQMTDDLADAMAADGRVSAEARRAIRLRTLAAVVLDWQLDEDLPCTTTNVARLLGAARWVEEQVDRAAADRAAYRRPADE
jgi:hypothetical protein